MNKFKGLLFCTDLDGTLYSSRHTVSKQNLEAIEYFKSEGGLFTFVTGRMPFTATQAYTRINPNAPYGCVNGDYNNDIAIIRQAEIGFAVANAVDEVKAVADHITVSNDEHAIAAIVDMLDRGECTL